MAESKYIEAVRAYKESLEHALEIANDPFKAPELNIEFWPNVLNAAWNMQVEFAAMNRAARKGEN